MRLLPACTPRFATRRRPRDSFGGGPAAIAGKLGQPFMPWQRDAAMVGCEVDETGLPAYREVIVTVPRQQGKALDAGTEILTARGWVRMQDIQAGDQVFHPAGHAVAVTFASAVMHGHDCYRVTTADGRSVVADGEHLWTVMDKRREKSLGPRGPGRKRWFESITMTTREMADGGVSRYDRGSRTSVTGGKRYTTNEYRFVLPAQEPLKSPDVPLPIDPYLFGAWLGDGNSRGAALTSHADDAGHWVAEVERCGFVPSVRPDRTAVRIGITTWPGAGRHGRSFGGALRRLGVLGGKHVPDLYLTAGTAQREALLQGLLDTDGCIDGGRAGRVEFCSSLRPLADAVLFLARSLGWRATLRIGRATLDGRDCGVKYRVSFTPKASDPFCPFRLARKAARIQDLDGNKGRATLSIAAIEPVASRPVRCIKVDSPDGLFLAGRDLVPTHNTTLFLSWQVDRCTHPRWAQPQRSAFTAQSGKDARDKWLDEIFPLLRRSRALRPGAGVVDRIYEGMGNEYVRFCNGSLIRLLSTSTSAGHSKTLHQAVLDEVWHDADGRREQGLRPAMLTVADAQVLVCSTAGTSASVVYNAKVAAGRKAAEADSGHGICYAEYSAPDGWDPDDEESYYSFMPALCPDPPCRCGRGRWRHTVTMSVIRGERDSMEPAEFARAYGNVPDATGEAARSPLDPVLWAARADPGSQVAGRVALGFQVRPDLGAAAVAVGGRRADGLGHGELTDHRPGTGWLVGRLCELADRWDPCVTVLNASGQAEAVLKDLIERGFDAVAPGKEPAPGKRRLWVLGAREYSQACGALVRDVTDGGWRHLGQAPAVTAAQGARARPLEGSYAWSQARSAADISPLEAITVARHGFMTFGTVAAPSPFALWGLIRRWRGEIGQLTGGEYALSIGGQGAQRVLRVNVTDRQPRNHPGERKCRRITLGLQVLCHET